MNYTKTLVENILKYPYKFEWSTQGLGMLRIYLSKNPSIRLHIWDSSLKVPGVSPLHTHPWNFNSIVVVGSLRNRRFTQFNIPTATSLLTEQYNVVEITCGENACTHGESKKIWLHECPDEIYKEGQNYEQKAEEIHFSVPEDGTVTIIERVVPSNKSADIANIYWRGNGSWVDAKPRKSTEEEIKSVTERALQTWF